MINLPPELIQIIFLKLCSTKTIFPLQDDPRLLVTHVCSQWRAIALRMPDLWANLRIRTNSPPPHDHIRTWISRSASSAFSVRFHGPLHHSTSSVDIFNIIIPAIQRCASLKLCVDGLTVTRLLTLPPGSLCVLRNISIRVTPSGHVVRMIPRECTAFQQCPWLRQVMLAFTGHAHPLDPTELELPWHQLIHLSIHSCPVREYEMLEVLRQCTALQECSISTFPARTMDIQRIAALSTCPIVLPSLHILRLELGHPSRSIHFVHALHLPRLRSLRLSDPSRLPCMLLPLVRPLLSETVRDLDLSGWTTTDLSAALALVPNLETLKFRNSDVEVLQALGRGILPRLVALKLNAVRPGDLFDMLEARAAVARADGGIASLADVSALDLGDGDMDTARFAALRAAGMRVVFRRWSP